MIMGAAMQKYDVIVIGGGPGGYMAAIRAASSGLNTALIEKDTLGGVCLNWGCIPTKALLRNAEVIRTLHQGDVFGFETAGIQADYAKAHARSRQVSEKLVKGIEYLMKKHKITVFKDTVRLSGPNEIVLLQSGQILRAQNILIATGSNPIKLPFLDYMLPGVLDSKGGLQLTEAPKSMIIIGAGAIGMEFATIFSAYGTAISVIEAQDRVLPNEDADISALIQECYEKRGMRVITDARITSVTEAGGNMRVALTQHGETLNIEAEYILSSAGICPNTAELGLETLGIAIDPRGFIIVDDFMRTNVPGIYAIGDVTGKLPLAHVASAQAIVAIEHIITGKATPISYAEIPKCTYTDPETASVGLTLQAAEEAGYSAASAIFPLLANGKAISHGDDAGFVKLVYDKTYGQLLGAHMAGAHVTEMIGGIAGYLGMEMTIDEMKRVIHPHPTVSEAIMEAAYLARGEAIHI